MRVTAVMVAYNRRELLREALEALAQQSRPVDHLVVVDNASDDGSGDVAEQILEEGWGERARLIRLTQNTGGAGGFAVGIAAAVVDPDTEWVWVMDEQPQTVQGHAPPGAVPGPNAAAGRRGAPSAGVCHRFMSRETCRDVEQPLIGRSSPRQSQRAFPDEERTVDQYIDLGQ